MAIKNFFKIQKVIFLLWGFNLFEENSKLRLFLCFLNMLPLIALTTGMCLFIINSSNNVDVFTNCASIVVQSILGLYKTILFRFQRHEYLKLIKKIEELSVLENIEEKKILQENEDINYAITRIFMGFSSGAGGTAIFIPMIKMIFLYFTEENFDLEVPFLAEYPYDWHNLKNFLFTYIWSAHGAFAIVTFTCSIDVLFFGYCMHVAGHFQILQHRIKTLNSKNLSYNEFKIELEHIVQNHVLIMELSDKINTLMTPILLGQFFSSSLQLCLLGYQVATKLNNPQVIFFAMFLIAVIIQLSGYCYGGNRIEHESQQVANAVYTSEWYQFPIIIQKAFVFTIQRSHKGNRIQPIFFEANLPTLTSILSTALSYICFLRTLSKSN